MKAIAWINRGGPGGTWGEPNALSVPCDARGLLLGEGVFETVLLLDGRPHWLAAHIGRWRQSAALLSLAQPPETTAISNLLAEAVARSGIRNGALRLNWCRGSGPRGLQAPAPEAGEPAQHVLWLQLSEAQPRFDPVRVIVSASEVRSATSLLSRCKSFGYGSALIARRQADLAGADDALLPSSAGGLCCGTSANLLVRSGGDRWLTPPLKSGCLPGIMRQRALELKLASEAEISERDLRSCCAALLLNSLGCKPISTLIDGAGVHQIGAPSADPSRCGAEQAEQLWRRLLET